MSTTLDWTAEPLPPSLPERLRGHSNLQIAYDMVRRLERSLDNRRPQSNRETVFCRILGYLLIHAPTDTARAAVALEIRSANAEGDLDAKLLQIGECYYQFLVKLCEDEEIFRPLFWSAKGRTGTPSNHSSRPLFDLGVDMVGDTLAESPRDYATAKKYGSTTVWTVLERFGYGELLDQLNGPGIHRLDNVMALSLEVHEPFESLVFWLVPSTAHPDWQPNTYDIQSLYPPELLRLPKTVRFESSDPERLPLPNPRCLEIHAACAKVAHLSGAAEYLENVLRGYEETRVLAEDGTSAELLSHLLTGS
ncbi:hypothetical protein CC1G_15218 [Coprinopsis cinerea okayama7|uniref:HNH nuclease domain-containing protein n=1 Tax=Coprinopsis cinerea (strain Okayama-7 / 130 / ATCC MYA-4618 / FGSC 9003) TaxID=240176 RepID=D6RPK3_COPC7|nr:hypothetical protein CC1G_15218 [Coprinopsis cinerea okayama7\|eukprot:XP_002910583.1 hypothetical protein CC1G_15218 [Coprinopsis cinerea okayama7\